jgi:hypothetical protein
MGDQWDSFHVVLKACMAPLGRGVQLLDALLLIPLAIAQFLHPHYSVSAA